MDIFIALAWGLAGWLLRVVWNYFKHSNEVEAKPRGKFDWKTFVQKYDQYWIMGFVAMIVFSLISDWAWTAFLSHLLLGRESAYDPKANVLIGFLAIMIVDKLDKKSKS